MRRLARRTSGDDGVAVVEMAIILPVLIALILGLFSGGQAYDKKLDMVSAVREGARYGATVPTNQVFVSGTWADNVAAVVRERAGSLPAGATVCVALVVGSPAHVYGSGFSTSGSPCFTETGTAADQRVQVQVQGTTTFDTLFFRRELTLVERSTVHAEVLE